MTAANKYPCRPHGTDGIRINDPGGSREGKGEKTGEDEMQEKEESDVFAAEVCVSV